MMKQLEKLVDVAVVVLEMYAVKLRAEIEGKVDGEIAELKKERKPRTPKVPAPAAQPAEVDVLGLGVVATAAPAAAPTVKELTPEESAVRIEEVTRQFIITTKNDKPEDGKTRAIRMMQTDARFKVGKLGDMTHGQRVLWIAEMEKGIEAKK